MTLSQMDGLRVHRTFLRVALEFGRHASSPFLSSGIVRFATLLIAMQDFSRREPKLDWT